MTELSELGKAAVAYAEMGLAVIPLKPRDKVPWIKGGSTKATANVEQVRGHWLRHPEHNIGIVCGDVSDGLVAIDIDRKGDVDGWDFVNEFEMESPLPEAPMVRTGSGGNHLLMRFPGKVINRQNAELGIDIRGHNGYVVAPPSIHPNGSAYEWVKAPWEVPIPVADEAARRFLDAVTPRQEDGDKLSMPEVIHEGEGRDNALYKLACSQRANNLPYETALVTVMDYNRRCCVPPMSERVVRQKVDSAYKHAPGHSEKVRMAEKAGDEDRPKRGRPRKFDHAKIAKRLIEERGACMLDGIKPAVRIDGKQYEMGWNSFDRAIIEMVPGCTLANRREVRSYVTAIAPWMSQSRWTLMAFANGVLDIETMELREWEDGDVICNVIPHAWNPDAKSDTLDTTFARIANGDVGVLANLSEILGMCMARTATRVPFMPVLIGSGANGKSTYMKLITNVLGEKNVKNLQPSDIGKRFMPGNLVGKLANLSDDIAGGYIDQDGCAALKKIVTGDSMFTDVKGGDGYDVKPYSTIVLACNNFPRVADTSEGFMRRLFAVGFNAKFTRDDPDYNPNIEDEMKSEEVLEAACVMGVGGLKNIMKENSLTPNRSNDMVKADIAESSNSALQWITGDGVGANDVIGKSLDEMYRMYTSWCERNGYARTAQTSHAVSKTVKEKFGLKLEKRASGTGNRPRVYTRL